MKKLIIVNALIWAAVIFIASYLYNGSENYQYLLGALAVGAILSNGFIYNLLQSKK
ncbi:hypothetical protein ACT6NV_01175 [Robiginitalea sp. IMCC44478]|uniref:hypothetical protein n=1 Tax=Robiginitalea sp. IMCC44478 TaxID=3459122 RepID=UPI004042BE67